MRGVQDSVLYGPDNVGAGSVGCADAPYTLRADLTLQIWAIPGGCDPGRPADGPDGYPCTDDDPGRQIASVAQADFACAGDCDGDGVVTIDELLRAVTFALHGDPPYACPSLIRRGGIVVTVDEIVTAVSNALAGCKVLTLE